ncbi:MAG: MmcQ/YjbR family DNA-binding protein [Ignavibacteria bacterium]|nr:MmcQ/YjbR family DNA-binding protein [Ignavibacteria bacterium]
MIDNESFRKLAKSFPEAEEMPHFEKTSFRVSKKIYATLNEKENRACVKLSENDQYVFCLNDKSMVYPVPNKWGLQGWTNIDLTKIDKKLLNEILKSSYREVAQKRGVKR